MDAKVRALLRTRLREALAGTPNPVDGILLLEHANVLWASGFDHSPSERPLGLYLPSEGEPTLFVPRLEVEHAEEVPDVRIEVYEEFPGIRHPVRWMHDRIAVRSDRPTRWAVDTLEARLYATVRADGHEIVLSDAATLARAVKQPEEMELVRSAARYADACLEWILRHGGAIISGGGSEIDVLRGGVGATRHLMDDELGRRFPSSQLHVVGTVHSGPRAALPHGRTGSRVPRAGEVLIAGIGAKVGGYHAESGATFVVGEVREDQARALAAADACGRAAIRATRPGIACHEVHAAAMEVLDEEGFTPHVRHRIGHGMGVEGHEAPWLAPGDATLVQPGMVFSNEPGIYRPGIDGYRTIDSMIVGADGAEICSRFQASVPWERRVLVLE